MFSCVWPNRMNLTYKLEERVVSVVVPWAGRQGVACPGPRGAVGGSAAPQDWPGLGEASGLRCAHFSGVWPHRGFLQSLSSWTTGELPQCSQTFTAKLRGWDIISAKLEMLKILRNFKNSLKPCSFGLDGFCWYFMVTVGIVF